jgi:hypothetical protein
MLKQKEKNIQNLAEDFIVKKCDICETEDHSGTLGVRGGSSREDESEAKYPRVGIIPLLF